MKQKALGFFPHCSLAFIYLLTGPKEKSQVLRLLWWILNYFLIKNFKKTPFINSKYQNTISTLNPF